MSTISRSLSPLPLALARTSQRLAAAGAGKGALATKTVARYGLVAVLMTAVTSGPLHADRLPPGQQTQPSVLAAVRAKLAASVGTSLGPPGGEVGAPGRAPAQPSRLYLGTADGHLYVSDDGAASWRASASHLAQDAVLDNLAVHPQRADLAYAAYWRANGGGGLVRTTDAGATWTALRVPGDPSLRALALAPSLPDLVYVGGIGGIWRSDDAGESWRSVSGTADSFQFVESLAVDPRNPDRVYAGTWRQAFRTLDGGRSWRRIHQGMAIDRDVFSVVIDPRNPDQLLAGTCNFIYLSRSGGDRWSELRRGLAPDHNRVQVVAHDPGNPEVLYAGTRGALYHSTDGGKSWAILLADVSVSSVAVGPAGDFLVVGTEERGVLVSRDGTVFEEQNHGLDASRVVAFDALPGAPRVLFAARSEGPTSDSVYFSTDVGTSWSRLGYGPSLGRVQLIRAQTEPVNRVLVVAERGWWSGLPGGHW
ncbi:MAG: YCF48-related protein, partial [Acidobacteriota bacterium]